MNITIRPEEPKDFEEVERLTREAFWDVYQPGCTEHLIVHKMRKAEAFVSELDLVATQDHKIIGHIMYSRGKVMSKDGLEQHVLVLGPISVLPSCQKNGVGSELIEQTKKIAKEEGYQAVILFGNPAYYHRFGFQNAERFQITTAQGENMEAFMALELYEGSLSGISGRFYEDPVFEVTPEELQAFEKKFPYKEKHITPTQLR